MVGAPFQEETALTVADHDRSVHRLEAALAALLLMPLVVLSCPTARLIILTVKIKIKTISRT